MKKTATLFLAFISAFMTVNGQQSVARQWNEVLLESIRHDLSRPTVHSRNLFHISAAMYDGWAAYSDEAQTFFLGNQVGAYSFVFDGVERPDEVNAVKEAQETAISYAAYRLLKHRFSQSIGAATSIPLIDSLMIALGNDTAYTSVDYQTDGAAALGNYLALNVIEFGFLDGADESIDYEYEDSFYAPVNPPLSPSLPGNPDIVDLNHWQPLSPDSQTPRRFLNPHWARCTPFSLNDQDLEVQHRNGIPYNLYHDPGLPPLLDTSNVGGLEDYYKWNFALVAVWSGHLDPQDTTMVDISPSSVGNVSELPSSEEDMREFYRFYEGGVQDNGHNVNPVTGVPYEEQWVPRGDFGRVLAEFWADGPKSETPPGHWFTILNYVNDHPLFEKRFEGTGDILDDLEWDVKSYLAMGGAMHDVAVAVWGIKSYYDYVRPISAIRGMAELGQSSDSSSASYHIAGIPLVEGHIELVESGDPLVGSNQENLGKIKLLAWRGPDHLTNDSSVAGVDWILAENWWPYQRPSFITPPFAGYVSGHSTFSRAAAEVLTLLTGDPYFPGGLGIFDAPEDQYLVFEEGPSVNLELQWATYRDAADQSSLSRLWGGIHPPVDDIPGRKIGKTIGPEAFQYAKTYFDGQTTATTSKRQDVEYVGVIRNYPNPVSEQTTFEYTVRNQGQVMINVFDVAGRIIKTIDEGVRQPGAYRSTWNEAGNILRSGMYFYQLQLDGKVSDSHKLLSITGN